MTTRSTSTCGCDDGIKFPRKFQGAMQAGVEETECGPILIPSPIKEDTKFMDIWRLKRLYANPARSQKLRRSRRWCARTRRRRSC